MFQRGVHGASDVVAPRRVAAVSAKAHERKPPRDDAALSERRG
jgi:hypothetical protein